MVWPRRCVSLSCYLERRNLNAYEGALLMDTNLYPVRLEDVLRSHISETFTSLDVEETVDFLSCMIKLVPRERANVRKLSRHCWLQSL